MRALVVGEKQARSDFLTGWRKVGYSPAHPLVGFDELTAPHPALSWLSPTTATLATGGHTAFASTAIFAPALGEIANLSTDTAATVLAAETFEHDGGAGAFGALTKGQRRQLAAVAPNLQVATVSDAPLLGLFSQSRRLCENDQQARAAAVDQRITDFITTADLPLPAPQLLRLARMEGSAMAGGVAFLLAALGAHLTPAREVFFERYRWAQQVRDCDVLIALTTKDSAEIAVDPLLEQLATAAASAAKPCAVVATDHHLPRRAFAAIGITDLYTRGERSWCEMGRALAQTWR